MTRSLVLVVNPTAGKGSAAALVPGVVETLQRDGFQVEVQPSRDLTDARRLAAAAVSAGVEVLAVMGGDGMMHVGVNAGAASTPFGPGRTALGLIPAGTGNDLCRGLGLDPADALAAAAVIGRGHAQLIDVMRVEDRYLGTVLATGFDAQVNRRANAWSHPQGQSRYVLATLAELRTFSPLRYRLRLDGVVRDLDAMLVAVGNTSSYGGGLRICPGADPTDGRLDVTIIHPVSRLKLLQLLPRMRSGSFARDPCVEQLQAQEVLVEGAGLIGYGDGELIGATPIRARVAPGGLRVLLPPAG